MTRTSTVDLRGQRGRGRQPRRPATDDRDGHLLVVHRTAPLVVQQRLSVRAAVETLAAAVHHAGAAPQAVEIGRRNGGLERVADLACGDPLAEADDSAVLRIGGDAIGVLIRTHEGLADVRHPWRRRKIRTFGDIETRIVEQNHQVLGDRHPGCQPGGTDSADQHVACVRVEDR